MSAAMMARKCCCGGRCKMTVTATLSVRSTCPELITVSFTVLRQNADYEEISTQDVTASLSYTVTCDRWEGVDGDGNAITAAFNQSTGEWTITYTRPDLCGSDPAESHTFTAVLAGTAGRYGCRTVPTAGESDEFTCDSDGSHYMLQDVALSDLDGDGKDLGTENHTLELRRTACRSPGGLVDWSATDGDGNVSLLQYDPKSREWSGSVWVSPETGMDPVELELPEPVTSGQCDYFTGDPLADQPTIEGTGCRDYAFYGLAAVVRPLFPWLPAISCCCCQCEGEDACGCIPDGCCREDLKVGLRLSGKASVTFSVTSEVYPAYSASGTLQWQGGCLWRGTGTYTDPDGSHTGTLELSWTNFSMFNVATPIGDFGPPDYVMASISFGDPFDVTVPLVKDACGYEPPGVNNGMVFRGDLTIPGTGLSGIPFFVDYCNDGTPWSIGDLSALGSDFALVPHFAHCTETQNLQGCADNLILASFSVECKPCESEQCFTEFKLDKTYGWWQRASYKLGVQVCDETLRSRTLCLKPATAAGPAYNNWYEPAVEELATSDGCPPDAPYGWSRKKGKRTYVRLTPSNVAKCCTPCTEASPPSDPSDNMGTVCLDWWRSEVTYTWMEDVGGGNVSDVAMCGSPATTGTRVCAAGLPSPIGSWVFLGSEAVAVPGDCATTPPEGKLQRARKYHYEQFANQATAQCLQPAHACGAVGTQPADPDTSCVPGRIAEGDFDGDC